MTKSPKVVDNPFSEAEAHEKELEAKSAFQAARMSVTEDNALEAASEGESKFKRLAGKVPKALKAMWDDLGDLIDMVKAYVKGDYREVPWTSIAAAVAAILYFVSPFDLIPDWLFGVGYIDDAAVISLCIKMIRSDIKDFSKWRTKRTKQETQD